MQAARRRASAKLSQLDHYTKVVNETILNFQNPVTGLIADTKTEPDAWIRDNVYAILAVWSLSVVHRKSSDSEVDRAKAYELEQSVVRLMRGLLRCFMLQIDKLEQFKVSQSPLDCLHAKFDSRNSLPIVADDKWGHLQMDAVSLYLLILAETSCAGIQIIQSLDEVAFVQNLVFYIEAAYRIPDYGIWERGDKTNHGLTELNASSVGMAHAALRALDGLNLFGAQGGSASLIHTLPDETSMSHAVLVSMLPRESVSKEVDSAVLAVIGYPAFAVNDRKIVEITRKEIREKLEGYYGCKRFLRDGYMTVLEDPNRLHYELHELKAFENIECEWPMFLVYLALDAMFSGDSFEKEDSREEAGELLNRLENLSVEHEGLKVIPGLYRVPAESVEVERCNPGSQPRVAFGRVPHKWAQSLYLVARLVHEKFIAPGELDPLNRRLIGQTMPEVVTQVVILAEDGVIKDQVAHHGIICQTIAEAAPVHVHRSRILSYLYSHLGKNKRLGLSGRASSELGVLATSKLYMIHDEVFAFSPSFFDQQVFYLAVDTEYLIDMFISTIAYLNKNWSMLGRPTVLLTVNHRIMDQAQESRKTFLSALQNLQSGIISGHRVQVGTLKQFTSTSCITRLSFLEHSEHFSKKSLDRFIQLHSSHHPRLSIIPADVTEDTRFHEEPLPYGRRMSNTAKRIAGIVSKRRQSVYPSMTPNSLSVPVHPDTVPRQHSIDVGRINKPEEETNGVVDATIAPFVPMAELTLDEFITTVEHHGSVQTQRLARPSSCSPVNMNTAGGSVGAADSPNSSISVTPRARPPNMLVSLHSSPSSKATQVALQADINELVESLRETSNLHEQADLIHCLYLSKGLDWTTPFECPVKELVSELGDRAMETREWWLVRHTTGVLRRRPDDLAKCLTDVLVRGKQITIGMPLENSEKVMTSPLPPDELENFIWLTCSSDPTLSVITQELIVDLAMLMKSEPRLFNNMIRIRIGLIIQVMASELGAMMSCTPEEATEHLFNLSPYQMKTLLSRVLSGSELAPKDKSMTAFSSGQMSVGQMVTNRASKRSFARQASHFAKELAGEEVVGHSEKKKSVKPSSFSLERSLESKESDDDSSSASDSEDMDVGEVCRHGQWFRRRRLDGSLNRVPVGFYARVWCLLERCEGLVIFDRHVPSSLTREMTQHELKFALHVEAALNRVPDPNYRQLFVEALSVLATLSEHDHGTMMFHGTIHVDRLIAAANDLFLEEQSAIEGGCSKQCCANFGSDYRRKTNKEICPNCQGPAGICAYFYDSAPSGRFGTFTYLSRAALYAFAMRTTAGSDRIDCPVS